MAAASACTCAELLSEGSVRQAARSGSLPFLAGWPLGSDLPRGSGRWYAAALLQLNAKGLVQGSGAGVRDQE